MEINTALKEGARGATRQRKAWSGKAIVGFQIALSTLLSRLSGPERLPRHVIALTCVVAGLPSLVRIPHSRRNDLPAASTVQRAVDQS